MKNLDSDIVDKISEKLTLTRGTVKKNIYSLSRFYPQATKNALAQIYAQKNGISVFKKLDIEDRQTLVQSSGNNTYNVKQYQTPPKKVRWYEREWLWAVVAVVIAVISLIISIFK